MDGVMKKQKREQARALYLGDNDCLYWPGEAHAKRDAFRMASELRVGGRRSRVVVGEVDAYGTYYPRQEIAEALASLAAIHSLSLDI